MKDKSTWCVYVGKFWWGKIGEWANLNQLEDKNW